jgi:hypothetical protein
MHRFATFPVKVAYATRCAAVGMANLMTDFFTFWDPTGMPYSLQDQLHEDYAVQLVGLVLSLGDASLWTPEAKA